MEDILEMGYSESWIMDSKVNYGALRWTRRNNNGLYWRPRLPLAANYQQSRAAIGGIFFGQITRQLALASRPHQGRPMHASIAHASKPRVNVKRKENF